VNEIGAGASSCCGALLADGIDAGGSGPELIQS